jgi:threonine aldolase
VAASFESDNYAGALPEVLAAIAAANVGHAPSYGDDAWTERAVAAFRTQFGADADVLFAFNGTGANVVALACLLRPHEAVICTESAHVHVDECGAPERFIGCKLLAQRSHDGKLRPAQVLAALADVGDEHRVQPRVVSISQATEWGTVYTPDELAALAEVARAHRLLVHVDGARLANAAAFLGVPLRDAAARADVVTVGGTKNGLLYGDAIVLLRPVADARFVRKQATQLASKMRFLAAQFDVLLADELWLRAARRANDAARRLAARVAEIPGVELAVPVESNGVFARIPPAALERLPGYIWDEDRSIVRWMTAWDSSDEDVDDFVQRVAAVLSRAG